MIGKLIANKKNNPCKICASTSGKCAESGEGLHLCMVQTTAYPSVNGFRFIGLTKDGQWGMWGPPNDRKSDQDRQTLKLLNQAERKLKEQEAKKLTESLVIDQSGFKDIANPAELLELAPVKPAESQRPFKEKIRDEFVNGSAISEVLFEAAVRLVRDVEILPGGKVTRPISEALGWNLPRFPRQEAALMINEDGSFWQAKLSHPRPKKDKKGELQRYWSRKGGGSRAYLPPVPPEIRKRISERYGIEVPLVGSFWEWFAKQTKVPYIITEGGKKALALLSLGYVAIALYGIDGGYIGKSKTEDGISKLIPDLEPFATEDRPIVLAFDQDSKAKTRENVSAALDRFYPVLKGAGCQVQIVTWQPAQGKGVDDLIVQSGVEAWNTAYSEAVPFVPSFGEFGAELSDRDRAIKKIEQVFSRYVPDIEKDYALSPSDQDVEYEGYAPTFDIEARTILLKGWLGAGKTEAVLRSLAIFAEALKRYKKNPNLQIVFIANRNGLLRQTAERFRRQGFKEIYHFQDDAVKHREMLRDGHPGIYFMTPDCFKKYATGDIDWTNKVVIIDEFSGARRELPSKDLVIPEFERMLIEAGKLIAVDAFLSNIDKRILETYRGTDRVIYRQKFQKSKIPIHWLETRTKAGEISLLNNGIFYLILKAWAEGHKKIAIAVDSKLQAKAIRDHLESLGCKGVLCCSETVESNQVLLKNPDPILADMEFFIYTPTAQSGVDCQTHFDCGLAIYSGTIAPIDFLQMIGRCRRCKEWYVSAPRGSINPNSEVSSLNSQQMRVWGQKLQTAFEEMEVKTSKNITGWSLWQNQTRKIEKRFHSEYLHCLLEQFFESITTLEVEGDSKQWKADCIRIKDQEYRKILEANLENGQKLRAREKAPSKDSEYWDIKLAEKEEKAPSIVKEARARVLSGNDPEGAIALFKTFDKCSKKLARYALAISDRRYEHLDHLCWQKQNRFTSYNSPLVKDLQYFGLFESLKLEERLAIAEKGTATAHETHFRYDSPIILELWDEFLQMPELMKFFPTIENAFQFWELVKDCMSRFFGFESVQKNIRVATPGELHPNGKNRDGSPRFSESKSFYFVGWLPMAEGGSVLFRENFELFFKEVSVQVNKQLDRWQEERERVSDRSQLRDSIVVLRQGRERTLSPPRVA